MTSTFIKHCPAASAILVGLALGASAIPGLSGAEPVWTPASFDAVPEIPLAEWSEGAFRMKILAPPGGYSLRRSTLLTAGSWSPPTILTTSSGAAEFIDAEGLPAAFYQVTGGFTETPHQLVGFRMVVSSRGVVGEPAYGGLGATRRAEGLRVQSADPTSGLIRGRGGLEASFRVEPLNPAGNGYTAWVERDDEDFAIELAIEEDRWTLSERDRTESIRMLDETGTSLVGLQREAKPPQSGPPPGATVEDRVSLELLWLFAESADADPADLAGDWGLLRWSLEGRSNGIDYLGEVFPATFSVGPGALTLSFSKKKGHRIEHGFPLGDIDVA